MKSYLDVQKNIKAQNQLALKQQDRQIAKLGIEQEEKVELRRNEYFDKLQKFQDINDQKTQNFIKYMKGDPASMAEERDRKMYIDGMKQEEKKWQLRKTEEDRK